MGALHEGHLALVRAARRLGASVAASIFVNPMQFGENEDFDRYPRDPEGDRAKLQAAGVDAVFAPSAQAMYPSGFSTAIEIGDIATIYEGAVRPGHFRGVATVVAKLVNITGADVLVLGQKDAQQTAVLRKLMRELDFPVRVEIVPTVREPDGLALSSRNVYLTPDQRAAAPTLHLALQTMLDRLQHGETAANARAAALQRLSSVAQCDYLDVVDAVTFAPLEYLHEPAFVIGAARFGKTRLIDNVLAGALAA
jgi:pantoate--beta-alanine ligase